MKVLVIGYVWPEPKSTAAGTRMLQLINFFLERSSSLTFATTATPSPYGEDLQKLGVETALIELNNTSFDSFLERLEPDLVVFDRFMMEEQFGWRVQKVCPEALRILDTEDLHFLRKHRELEFVQKTSLPLTSSDLVKREIASIFRCDLSLIISEAEMEILTKDFKVPEELLLYLPFYFEEITDKYKSLLPDFSVRKDFISLGNFKHSPNVDAIAFLKEKIWPLIHNSLPDAKMLVYGGYPSVRIVKLNDPKINFFVKGRAENSMEEVKKAKVSLAPLRFGAGLKGKLTEAMVCGTPTVTTKTGAEGINGKFPWNGFIEESPEEIARASVELYTNQEKWEQSVKNGFRIIEERFSKDHFYSSFSKSLENLVKTFKERREQNFIGAMLQHHRVKSTYYLSKYIEVKREMEKIIHKK